MKSRLFLPISFTWLLFVQCSQPAREKMQYSGEAQGTYYAISCYAPANTILQPSIDSVFAVINHSASLWEKESIISRFNANDSTIMADAFFQKTFTLAQQVSSETDGYFDCTIGPLVQAWGFGLGKRDSMSQEKVAQLLERVDYKDVKLVKGKLFKKNPAMLIDFNAIAQGITVDELASLFRSRGIQHFIIDVGGEVFASASKPDGSRWRVGIEQPSENQESDRVIQQVVSLQNLGLATSGSYRQYYEDGGKRFAHIIDPKTGYPVTHSLLSVSVLASSAGLADAYATAFLAMGQEKALETIHHLDQVEAFFISARPEGGFTTYATDGFEAILSD